MLCSEPSNDRMGEVRESGSLSCSEFLWPNFWSREETRSIVDHFYWKPKFAEIGKTILVPFSRQPVGDSLLSFE